MTWSILARDPATGEMAVAVASRFFAVGAIIPHMRDSRAAVATQAFVSPLWGVEGADRIARGEAPAAVLADLQSRDSGQHLRQWHGMGADGVAAAHTGAGCVDWAGHVAAPNVSVAGNMLAGPQVIEASRDAFLASEGEALGERMLLAMEAGEKAGGDKRGRQSACLRIHRGEVYPWLDLRADDHAAPLVELRRLWTVAHERFVHFATGMGTAENFSGTADRAPITAMIEAAEAERRATGRASASRADPPES
jgi:uncharacterized Ntn-hydrolase superfamily protein